MARTQEQDMQDAKDFEAAYAAEDPAKAMPSDDDDFGMNPEAAMAEDDGIPNSPDEAIEIEPEAMPAEMPAEPVAQAQPAGLSKEEQRLKSWEGRLRARDAQGVSVEAEPEEAGEDPATEVGETASSETGEYAAQSVEGMSPDEAMKKLNDDFGPEFTAMINALIDAKVSQAASGTNEAVHEIIADIVDSKARAHFERISDAHPDFMEIEKSPEFREYVMGMDEQAKPEAIRIVKSGSAREINALLSAFKASRQEPQEQPQAPMQADPGLDAAEGVRSSGIRLPTQPSASSDYEAAWREFD